MEQHCYKCNVEICYNPLQCDICGVNICLNCCDDDIICDTCKTIQEGAMIGFVNVQCTHIEHGIQCTEMAIINQDCSSTKQISKKRSKNVVKCLTPVQFCIKHIKQCRTCNNYICEKCYTNCNACWQDSFECDFCLSYFGSIRSCGICSKKSCRNCIARHMDFLGKNEIPMCYSHREPCSTCNLSVYKAKSMRCQYIESNKQCRYYACVNGWFDSNLDDNGKVISWGTSALTTINKKIYVCHKHITRCPMCDMSFPMTNSRTVKFRNGLLLSVCTNCYKPFQSMIDAVLISLKRQKFSVPRDVFGIIVGYVITDSPNEKSTNGNCH